MTTTPYDILATRFCKAMVKVIDAFADRAEKASLDYIYTYHYIHSVKQLAENYIVEIQDLARKLGNLPDLRGDSHVL